MSIFTSPVSSDKSDPDSITSRWGITACEYKIGSGTSVDLQDLMVEVTKNRAVVIEGEVNPLSVRIRKRNEKLEDLGDALSELTKLQTAFDKDAKGDAKTGGISQKTRETLKEIGFGDGDFPENKTTKSKLEGMISKVKSTIDGLNNESQMDMSRLQQLVDQRDQSYSTATTLMTAISDTRANLVRNL